MRHRPFLPLTLSSFALTVGLIVSTAGLRAEQTGHRTVNADVGRGALVGSR